MSSHVKLKRDQGALRPYTVHYRTTENRRMESCFYALDAFEARLLAMEFNQHVKEHPNSIDLIRCEADN